MSSFLKIHPNKPFTKAKPLSQTKRKLRVFCVYFPQFHTFIENDTNFYPGYTDIINLDLLMTEKPAPHYLSPNLKELGLNKTTDYDLIQNKNLIPRQLQIMQEYNIEGLAIYYYWFTTNSISNNHMIMKAVVDKFFDETVYMYGRKVFFMWANDNWTSNKWFGGKNNKLENTYTKADFQPNIANLMTYFKHNSYLKINNKPVLFLHHPFLLTTQELNNFELMLNKACKLNGFDGINLALNNKIASTPNYVNYSTPTIKNIPNNTDFTKCVQNMNFDQNIQFINFDFDNEARMYKPFRDNIRRFINVNEKAQELLLQKTINHYNTSTKISDMDDLLLINAWNEWGEQMSIEPSEQKGYYFLDLIKKYLP